MKVAAAAIVILAVVIGVVPLFTDCLSQGRSLTTTSGMMVPMKCHWTAEASLGMALPLLGLGVVTAFSRRKETRRMTAGLGALLGAVVILLPTVLIGVCASSDMLCNSVMRPTLILGGTLVIAISIGMWFAPQRLPEQMA